MRPNKKKDNTLEILDYLRRDMPPAKGGAPKPEDEEDEMEPQPDTELELDMPDEELKQLPLLKPRKPKRIF